MSGEAMAMQLELASLMRRHGYTAKPHIVPLAAPSDHAVEISGLAATTDIDLGRQKFRGWAFSNPCLLLSNYPKPPLYWRHDETRTVGEITTLKFDHRGQLQISARVDDPLARRANAFSVGAKVLEYSLVDDDTENFHALITRAEICEISLTDRPCNPNAVVRSRDRAVMGEYLKTLHTQSDLMIRSVQIVQQGFDALAKMYREQASVTPARPTPRPQQARRPRVVMMASEPHRATPFGKLVDAMEQRSSP